MKKQKSDAGAKNGMINEVRLVGRLPAAAEVRTLPSGDMLGTFRLVVDRTDAGSRSRASVDVIDCVVWGAGPRRSALGWAAGDLVEVSGALRRRFYRSTSGGTGSRTEVEVLSCRRRRRGGSG